MKEKLQKKLLQGTPDFFSIVEAEANILGCTSSALIRAGVLSFIAKNHQCRIPLLFRGAKILEDQQIATIELYKRIFKIDHIDTENKNMLELNKTISLEIYARAVELLNGELKKLNS